MDPSTKARVQALLKRVDDARDFPTHTCPASRHVHIMADNLVRKGGYCMLTEEPVHCAESILAALASLWEGRKELADVTAKVREIHETMKRGKDTQDHGLMENLACILDHACRRHDPPLL